jgi:hypothetical protein
VGTAAYAAEFVGARGKLLGVFQGGLEVIHGFPIPLGGITDKACVRSLVDLVDWLESVGTNTARDLVASRGCFKQLLLVAGSPEASADQAGLSETSAHSGSHSASEPMRMSLPVKIDSNTCGIFHSEPGFIPVAIEPVNELDEAELLTELVLELNTKFMTDLVDLVKNDQSICSEIDWRYYFEGKKIIVMGGSHAGRMASELDAIKLPVVDLSTPGWKITDTSVDSLIHQLQAVLKEDPDQECILIYHVFDNSVYFSTDATGGRVEPVKIDGRYHIIGDLDCCQRDDFKDLFSSITLLLRAGGNNRKIIMSPLIRYGTRTCCSKPDHLTNFKLKTSMRPMLAESPEWLQNLAFFKRIREVTVVAPHELLSDGGTDERTKEATRRIASYWDQDPVHMTRTGYAVLAKQLAVRISRTGGTAAATAAKPAQKGTGKGRRPSWVSMDKAVATRTDVRGRQRGGGQWPGPKHGGGSRGFRGGWHRARGGHRGWPY